MAETIQGHRKAAILMLALGDQFTQDLFKRLERKEITQIVQAMVDMETVPKEEVEAVLKEFNESMTFGHEVLIGGQDQALRLLSKSLDSDVAKYVVDTLELESGPSPFKELETTSPRLLAQILRNEHPQTLALILGHLPPERGAELLQSLPPGVRPEVLMRLSNLEAVPEEMLYEVDKVLQRQLIAMGGREGRKVGGVSAVAEVLNAVDRSTEEEVLAEIEEENSQLAEDIRQLMFVFDDILKLDDRSIRELLKEVGNDELTLALKGSSDELKDKFYKNLSERAATMIQEDLEIMGPVRLSDVEGAQQSIVRTVRRLEAEGRVVITREGGDVFV